MVIGIIGGSGLADVEGLEFGNEHTVNTPYGDTSAPIRQADHNGIEVMFLARHGAGHHLPPHSINYRANLWALKHLGVDHIIAVNAVGGITTNMGPEIIALPDQLIDYTYGREHTFSSSGDDVLQHVDFSHPYDESLRKRLAAAFYRCNVNYQYGGVYGATQGPRLETAAEVSKLERDGCDLVGMTGMPEAGLARELGIAYSSVCLVVNWAAGKSDSLITMAEIEAVMATGMNNVRRGLLGFLDSLHTVDSLATVDSI
ncbi:MAG: 5'-methylthioinosine phosphorylase [Porticoccus sp.]|jgi:5'-methylthioinosine phosphorylase